jgi:outer membrane biosynthesis protein TonB
MKRTTLLTTAAVLMLGAGAAFAQAPAPSKDQAPPQAAPAAQQSAPAEKTAPNAPVRPAQAQAPNAGDPAQAQKSPTSAPAKNAADAKSDMKVPSAAANAETKSETKSETKTSVDAAKPDAAKPDAKASDTNKSGVSAASTTGQGAGAAARLSTEQRSKITTVIKQQNVQPVTLNVSIRVGTRVPSTVRYYPLPTEVITIYPEWRGYNYILVRDQILVLDPGTYEIVAILDA